MLNINFDEGLEEIKLNNDDNRIIKFNPADYGILTRAKDAEKTIQDKLADLKDIKVDENGDVDDDTLVEQIKFVDTTIKEQINYIFNAEVADVIFNGASSLTSVKGKFIIESFFETIMPVVTERVKEESNLSQKRVSKYTDKYDNLSKEAKENYNKLVKDTTKVSE